MDWLIWLVLGMLVAVLLALIAVAHHLGRNAAHALHAADVSQLDRRLTSLEARVEHLPTHRDLIELRVAMGDVSEAVAQVSGQTTAITQMLRSIQEHLLEGDRR